MWKEVEHGTILSDHGQIHIIEFPKFHETWEEADDPLEKWVSFLTEVDQMQPESTPKWNDEKLEQAYRELKHLSQNPELRAQYEAQLREIRDYQAGLEDSYLQGIEQGHHEIVRNMLGQGLEAEAIAKLTGLSIEIIQTLASTKD